MNNDTQTTIENNKQQNTKYKTLSTNNNKQQHTNNNKQEHRPW